MRYEKIRQNGKLLEKNLASSIEIDPNLRSTYLNFDLLKKNKKRKHSKFNSKRNEATHFMRTRSAFPVGASCFKKTRYTTVTRWPFHIDRRILEGTAVLMSQSVQYAWTVTLTEMASELVSECCLACCSKNSIHRSLQHALVERAGTCLVRDVVASKPDVFPVNWIVPGCNLYKQPDRPTLHTSPREESHGRGFVNLNALAASTRGGRVYPCVRARV